jgi:predicted nucleic acid-binding protein
VNLFYCDASALGKRYAPEVGTPLVNHLFAMVPHNRLVMLTQGLGETLSILVRRKNAGLLAAAAYQQASQAMRDELIAAGQVQLLPAEDALVFTSLPLIEQHSINSTDALVLRSALDLAETLRPAGNELVLVASDARLLRAAGAEGLTVFNPETDSLERLDALLIAS